MVDHPYDKATSEFLITAPSRYQVVANGLLQEQRDLPGEMRLTHWQQSVPIASWLNAIGVAQFAVHHAGEVEGVGLQSWVYPQDRDKGFADFEPPARQAMEFFSRRVGPYPYEKLANVQAAGLSGGTEHASAIFYGETSVGGSRNLTNLVAHEIAHQWFGNSVTQHDWDDVWLSEGFATYFALLFTEHYSGRDALVAGLKRSRTSVLNAERRSPTLPVIHRNLSDTRRVLNQLVYQKGGWTLHMLRAAVGTEKFWEGIREYYRRHRDGNASTDDLRRVFEEVSQTKLDWFFDQWLKRAGSPVIKGSWRYDVSTKRVELNLTQSQEGEAYRLPMEVGILTADAAIRIEKIEMTEREQRFSFAAEQKPASLELDPNTWVLMQATLSPAE
jgi:aminopeptidase N